VKVKLVECTGIDHCHVGSVDGVHVLMIFFGCTALAPIFMIETNVEANALRCVPLVPTLVLIAQKKYFARTVDIFSPPCTNKDTHHIRNGCLLFISYPSSSHCHGQSNWQPCPVQNGICFMKMQRIFSSALSASIPRQIRHLYTFVSVVRKEP
jgi:hypothetical protein